MRPIITFSLLLAAYALVPAACGNPQAQAQNKSNANEQLIGSWGYFGDKSQPGVYIFNQDGTCIHYTAVRNNYLRTGSLYAMEVIYKGNYRTDGNTILFSNVSIAKFDRSKDNANRNLIGDIAHAKKMLNTTTGFSPWTLEPVEFNFIEQGVVRIAKKDDQDEIRTIYRADWDKDIASSPEENIDQQSTLKSKQKDEKGEAAPDKTTNSFQLKIYHGFDFPNNRVVKYGSEPSLVDVAFYQQTRRLAVFAYLRAAKIREFDSPPTGLSSLQVDAWEDYVFSPKSGGYYVIRSRDRNHYLLHLKKFENQAKAAGYWLLDFEWEKIIL
ncbi:MAG: hypothetical protein KIT62_07300 [Cyclobacteriaceae bacterium]|nr:hypothetical protein [Cyclobacteriaceae bacterium]